MMLADVYQRVNSKDVFGGVFRELEGCTKQASKK